MNDTATSDAHARTQPIAASVRTNFFDEQRRRRRSGHVLSFICLLIAGGIGIIMSSVVTPLVLLAGGGLLHLAAWCGLIPTTMRDGAHWLGSWAAAHLKDFEALLASLDHVNRLGDLSVTVPPLLRLAPVCLPALTAAALVWLALRGIATRAEGEDLAARLGGRVANTSDLEEHQLANIVEEIGIAAGIPAPRLLLVDSPEINAAAVGRSRQRATILVTRGLLDSLDRDETSGVVAHLVASIGKGDIRLSHGILAVFQTFGFFLAFLDLPFRGDAWRALSGLALVVLGVRRSPTAVAQTLLLLEEGIGADSMPDVETMWSVIPSPKVRKILLAPLLPLLLLNIVMKLVLFLWTALFLGPPLAMIWRNRRYSADAMAVQLTRNPDGLARALSKIGNSGIPRGGEGREYCFIHGPGSPGRGSVAKRRIMTMSLHPSLARRWGRLVAAGAQGHAGRQFAWLNQEMIARYPVRVALVVFLMLLLIPLGVLLVVMVGYLTLLAITMGLAGGLTIAAGVLA